MKKDKEFLYVGHYIDTDSNYILKIGTTKNLERMEVIAQVSRLPRKTAIGSEPIFKTLVPQTDTRS
jgi:hypothetical protein